MHITQASNAPLTIFFEMHKLNINTPNYGLSSCALRNIIIVTRASLLDFMWPILLARKLVFVTYCYPSLLIISLTNSLQSHYYSVNIELTKIAPLSRQIVSVRHAEDYIKIFPVIK